VKRLTGSVQHEPDKAAEVGQKPPTKFGAWATGGRPLPLPSQMNSVALTMARALDMNVVRFSTDMLT